ncbi:Preprotein translocase subunit SecB [Butyrivibrio sp. YAB3001]|nr:Preprotein translocase subunit SecB [Butyrivibrio sp. YAB3001]
MKVFCQNLIINRIVFERNMKEMDNSGIELSIVPKVAQNRDENNKRVRLETEIIIGEKGKTSFWCEMNIISILSWSGETHNFDEEIIRLGIPYVMSFARVKVIELCQQAGVKPVYLPELE